MKSQSKFCTWVSKWTGQCNFLGQKDKSSFIVLGQRDNGTSSKSCHGTARDGILNRLSRPVPGRPGTKSLPNWQKKVKINFKNSKFFFFKNCIFLFFKKCELFYSFYLLSRACPAGQENPVPLEALIGRPLLYKSTIEQKLDVFYFCFLCGCYLE